MWSFWGYGGETRVTHTRACSREAVYPRRRRRHDMVRRSNTRCTHALHTRGQPPIELILTQLPSLRHFFAGPSQPASLRTNQPNIHIHDLQYPQPTEPNRQSQDAIPEAPRRCCCCGGRRGSPLPAGAPGAGLRAPEVCVCIDVYIYACMHVWAGGRNQRDPVGALTNSPDQPTLHPSIHPPPRFPCKTAPRPARPGRRRRRPPAGWRPRPRRPRRRGSR